MNSFIEIELNPYFHFNNKHDKNQVRNSDKTILKQFIRLFGH